MEKDGSFLVACRGQRSLWSSLASARQLGGRRNRTPRVFAWSVVTRSVRPEEGRLQRGMGRCQRPRDASTRAMCCGDDNSLEVLSRVGV